MNVPPDAKSEARAAEIAEEQAAWARKLEERKRKRDLLEQSGLAELARARGIDLADKDARLAWKAKRAAEKLERRRSLTVPDAATVRERLQQRDPPADPHHAGDYAFQLTSQHGEDGIVHALVSRSGAPEVAVEIGCGANGGNAGLLAALGWRTLMLDGNRDLTELAAAAYSSCPRTTVLAAWITRETVNDLIVEQGFGTPGGYLGIDLDGVDYWIWRALRFESAVVVAEYNALWGAEVAATIPYDERFSRKDGPKRPPGYWGVSLEGLVRLARGKGYRLVAVHHDNAFFVQRDLCSEFRTVTPADAFWERTKGYAQLYAERIREAGVFEFYEKDDFPLVPIRDDGEPDRAA